MQKKLYIATLVEKTYDDEYFPIIHHADTPEELIEKIKDSLETEQYERGIGFEYNEKELLDDIAAGNESSGPYIIEADNDSEFFVATKVIEI